LSVVKCRVALRAGVAMGASVETSEGAKDLVEAMRSVAGAFVFLFNFFFDLAEVVQEQRHLEWKTVRPRDGLGQRNVEALIEAEIAVRLLGLIGVGYAIVVPSRLDNGVMNVFPLVVKTAAVYDIG
jgi:hypothetical protein